MVQDIETKLSLRAAAFRLQTLSDGVASSLVVTALVHCVYVSWYTNTKQQIHDLGQGERESVCVCVGVGVGVCALCLKTQHSSHNSKLKSLDYIAAVAIISVHRFCV